MALELRLSQKMDLQLRLAPQIIQSIEILQLPTVDLQELVKSELDTNEFLEIRSDEDDTAVVTAAPEKKASDQEEGVARELERLEQNGHFDDDEIPRFKSALNYEASDRKLEAMNNTADRGPSLHEMLLEQYALLDVDLRFRPIAERLISFVNDNGLLECEPREIVEIEFPDLTPEDADAVLVQIQSLEPRGIAARSIEECLLLQLDVNDPRVELKRRLVTEFLEDLKKNRRPKIAKALGIDLPDLAKIVIELGELDYQPGRSAVDVAPRYIYPDIAVDWTSEGYEVRLAGTPFPQLQLTNTHREVLGDKKTPSEFRDQVRKQVDNAKWLISAIEQRQQTLMRVARRIVHYQRDFLDFGPHYLRPLKMQQIADDLGIHVSTVSRATNEKYMQTHRGIFSLKSFFSGAAVNSDGGVESRASVKQRVMEIIAAEDKQHPLSDEAIVRRLKDSFGTDVARRTVTKYRKALSIPSTRQRRVY